MKILKKLLIFAATAVLLSACGTGGGGDAAPSGETGKEDQLSVSVEGMEKTEGLIVAIEDGRVLVNDVSYSMDENTHLVSLGDGSEKTLAAEDLEKGMRVDVYHSGVVALSLPGQAYADVFAVQKGEEEMKQAEAFRSFLEEEDDQPWVIKKVEFPEGEIRFDYTSDSNEEFRVELDTDTKAYTKEPIDDEHSGE